MYLRPVVIALALGMSMPAFAQNPVSDKTPGYQMHDGQAGTPSGTGASGASDFAPGHQKNTNAGPGHSESAPGMQNKDVSMPNQSGGTRTGTTGTPSGTHK